MTVKGRNFFLLFGFLFFFDCEYCYYLDSSVHHKNITLNNFSFGSCFGGYLKMDEKLDIFKQVLSRNPDLWLWLGDVAYIEPLSFNVFERTNRLDMDHVQKEFNFTKNNLCKYSYY